MQLSTQCCKYLKKLLSDSNVLFYVTQAAPAPRLQIRINTIKEAMDQDANSDVSFAGKIITEVTGARDDQNRMVYKFCVADNDTKIHVTSYNKASRDLELNSTYLFTSVVNKKAYFISKYTFLVLHAFADSA